MKLIFCSALTCLSLNSFSQGIKEVLLTKQLQKVPEGKVWYINNQSQYIATLSTGVSISGTSCNSSFHSNPRYLFGLTYLEPDSRSPKTLGFTIKNASTLDDKVYNVTPYFFIEDHMGATEIKASLTMRYQPKEMIFQSGTSIRLTSCLAKLVIQERDATTKNKVFTKRLESAPIASLPSTHPQQSVINILVEAKEFSEGIAQIAIMVQGKNGKEKKYGYLDSTGNLIQTPKYVKVEPFKEGFGLATLERYEGVEFIDKSGRNVFAGSFSEARSFQNGFAAVKLGDKWAFLNKRGELITKIKYDAVRDFNEGLAAVAVNRQGWGFVDTLGNEVIIPQFASADQFSEGLACVSFGDYTKSYIYIDKTGKPVIKLERGDAPYFGRSKYSNPIPLSDNWESKTEALWRFKNGLAVIVAKGSGLKHNRLIAIDRTGNAILKFKDIDNVYSFSDGLWKVSSHTKYGFINSKGKWAVSPEFDEVGEFREGLARVASNKNCGFIDKTGKVLINPDLLKGPREIRTAHQFTEVSDFSEGLALVEVQGKHGFIDKSGKWVIPPDLEAAAPFRNGIAPVKLASRMGWNYVDRKGNILFGKYK